jgi:hypothetical protein
MCWKGNSKLFSLQVTQEDIPVYKVISYDIRIGNLRAWFGCYLYDEAFKVTQHSEISFTATDNGYIEGNRGFHAYEVKPCFYKDGIFADNYVERDIPGTVYYEGDCGFPLVVKCHIPKGALYASNGKETISTAIKFDEIVSVEALDIVAINERTQTIINRYKAIYNHVKTELL